MLSSEKNGLFLSGISKQLEGKPVLDNISMEFNPGMVYGLIGPNGSGKTTLLKIISTLYSANTGSLKFYESLREKKFSSKQIGFLIEEPHFYEDLKVFEFLDWIGQIYGLSVRERNDRLIKLIADFSLTDVAHQLIRRLSKGYRQRLGLAVSLVHQPLVILWDEPFNGLDPQTFMQVRKIMRQLKEQGKIIIIAAHQLYDIQSMLDGIYFLKDGKCLEQRKASDFETGEKLFQFYQALYGHKSEVMT